MAPVPYAADPIASATLDDALRRIHRHAPEYGGGLSDHAPMVVEALCAMGRADAVGHWLPPYLAGHDPAPADGMPLAGNGWRAALGNLSRHPQFVTTLATEIRGDGWRATLARWLPRLAPGMIGAAAHGLIRTAHAVRAINAGDTAPRRRELAEGLAYWAASYTELPGAHAGGTTAGARPSDVLLALPRLPAELRGNAVFLTDVLAVLDRFPPFATAIAAVDPDADAFLSDLSATAARVFVANAGCGFMPLIATVHAVTATAAARTIAPYVGDRDRRGLLRHAWQTVAALYVALADAPPAAREDGGGPAPDGDFASLLDGALAVGDEHAIKLVEACAREDAIRPDPSYRIAAADGVQQFDTHRRATG